MATILIADHSAVSREFLGTVLRASGHLVREASTGQQAMALVRAEAPELVISDIRLPTASGTELARSLARDHELGALPIILYTAAYRAGEAKTLAASCGLATVLAKPSEPQALLDAVHGELGIPRATVGRQVLSMTARNRALVMDQLAAPDVGADAAIRVPAPPAGADSETQRNRLVSYLDNSAARAHGLSMRLGALVELGLDLAEQSDPDRMLEMCCDAARDVLYARIAGICVLREDGRVADFVVSGTSAQTADALREALEPRAGVLGRVLRGESPNLLNELDGDPTTIGLPIGHPDVRSLIVLPIKSATRTRGWFYAANASHSDGFHQEDEQLARTLVAQLTWVYENLLLFDRIKRHSGLLQQEIDERKRTMAQLAESELRFRQLAETIQEVFFLREPNGELLYVSPALEVVAQRSRESVYADPASWQDLIHPEDRDHAVANIGLPEFDVEYRIVRPDGAKRWIHSRGFPIRDSRGEIVRVAGIAKDITERKAQELKIGKLSRIHAVLSGINSAIVRIHERRALLDEACRIACEQGEFPIAWIAWFGAQPENTELVASRGVDANVRCELDRYGREKRWSAWRPGSAAMESKAPAVYNDLAAEMSAAAGPVARAAIARGCGSMISLPLLPGGQLVGAMFLYAEGAGFFDDEEVGLLSELADDVSFALQYITKEEQLTYLAYYDSLTGLPNATLFNETVTQVLSRQSDDIFALYLVDLDRFTQLNDSLGRRVGDQILTEVGRRLRAALPEPASLARIGADTFAVLSAPLRRETDTGSIVQEQIPGALSRPIRVDEHEIRITARTGVATYPADATGGDTLFSNAEAALQAAKSSGARYQFYSRQLNARVSDDLALEHKLLSAVERGEFVVYYQPKVDSQTGTIVGLEALLRWQSPEDGLVPPDRFIPALEESELILEVGRWLVDQVLCDCARWDANGVGTPKVAINVSPIQLRYPSFAESMLRAVERKQMQAAALELEITESVIMTDIEANAEQLRRIAESGMRIAIDDFGTGYSSLRYLARLPVHALKIDRSFVTSMTEDAGDMTLVSTIINLAHSFDLEVVAEGVETEEQAKLLRLMKCGAMQGYLFGAPVPAVEIEGQLRASAA